MPLSVTEKPAIGGTMARPGNSFYLVRIRVSNTSNQPYGFEMHQIVARAVDGDRLVRSMPGEGALGASAAPETVLPHQTAERQIAFESSPGAHQVAVLFSQEGGPRIFLRGLIGTSEQVVVMVGKEGSFHSEPKPRS